MARLEQTRIERPVDVGEPIRVFCSGSDSAFPADALPYERRAEANLAGLYHLQAEALELLPNFRVVTVKLPELSLSLPDVLSELTLRNEGRVCMSTHCRKSS